MIAVLTVSDRSSSGKMQLDNNNGLKSKHRQQRCQVNSLIDETKKENSLEQFVFLDAYDQILK